MTKTACKIVVDWYAALGAEAAGLYTASEHAGYSSLAAEAMALWEGSKGICEAGSEMADYLVTAGDEESLAFAKQLEDMSVLACDWAKSTRRWTDRVVQRNGGKVEDETITKWIAEMRKWRDDGAALVRTIAGTMEE